MKAPEKIYLERILCSNEVYDNWKTQKTISDDIEYTRTDAFIYKAKEVFCKAMCNDNPPRRSTCASLGACKEYDNFVKFMK